MRLLVDMNLSSRWVNVLVDAGWAESLAGRIAAFPSRIHF